MKESPLRPALWRRVTLTDAGPGKFNVCLAYTYSRIDKGILALIKLPADTPTENLSLKAAIKLGMKIEEYIQSQPVEKRHRRNP
jgi:hypothetical protein